MSKELPTQPSLRNLKIQAKNLLKACRNGDAAARQRVREYHPKLTGDVIGESLRLADIQWALAREYGFESWPKLVASLPPEIRYYKKRHFSSRRSLQVGWIDRDGDNDPCAGGEHTTGASTAGRGFVDVPDCRIWFLEPDQVDGLADWKAMAEEIEASDVPGLCLRLPIDDQIAHVLGDLDDLRYLNICSGPNLTDEGMLALRRLTRLEYLQVGGYGGLPQVTDRGLACLESMPELKVARLNCSEATGKSVFYLREHQALRLVQPPPNSGDEALSYLKGKPRLSHLFLRCQVTDVGVAQLREFPALTDWQEDAEKYRIIEYSPPVRSAVFFDCGQTNGLSDEGLAALSDLGGVEELWLYRVDDEPLTSRCMDSVACMARLERVETGGKIIDDHALSRLGEMPLLSSLYLGSGSASDTGFEALSKSKSLSHLAISNFGGISWKGISAISRIQNLERLGLGIHDLPVEAFDSLRRMKRLREFNPNYVGDEAFEAVSQIDSLESIMIMYCDQVTDRAVKALERLPRLRDLSIWSGHITDASCSSISGIQSLEKLLFYRRDITDEGIRMLATLPCLKSIDLQENLAVSRDSLKAFGPDVRVNFQPPPIGYIRLAKMKTAVQSSEQINLKPLPISGSGDLDFEFVNLNEQSEYSEEGVQLNGGGAGLLFPSFRSVPFSWKAEIKPLSGRWNLLFGQGRIELPAHFIRSRIALLDPLKGNYEYIPFAYRKVMNEWREHRLVVEENRLRFSIGDETVVDAAGDYRSLATRLAIEFRGSLIVRNVILSSL